VTEEAARRLYPEESEVLRFAREALQGQERGEVFRCWEVAE
jgi:hypothetical protein